MKNKDYQTPQCVYTLPYNQDIYNRTFDSIKIHPIRPYCKRVSVWIEPQDKPVNSLVGKRYSKDELGVQYAKFKNDSKLFENFPIIDETFYFLLGTQRLVFYCKKVGGKVYKISTSFEAIPSSEWVIS